MSQNNDDKLWRRILRGGGPAEDEDGKGYLSKALERLKVRIGRQLTPHEMEMIRTMPATLKTEGDTPEGVDPVAFDRLVRPEDHGAVAVYGFKGTGDETGSYTEKTYYISVHGPTVKVSRYRLSTTGCQRVCLPFRTEFRFYDDKGSLKRRRIEHNNPQSLYRRPDKEIVYEPAGRLFGRRVQERPGEARE